VNTRMTLGTAALVMILATASAYPQNRDILQLSRDVLEVQARVKQLQTTVDQDNALMKGLIEKMADQVAILTSGMQKLSQNVESIKSQNDGSTKELRTTLTTLSGTVKEMEEGLSSARAQINSISQNLAAPKTTAEPLASADDIWRNAYVDYSGGAYDSAISGYQEFLTKFPNDPRAVDVQLRIGDALVAQKKIEQAITQFDIVLQKYPDSDRTKTALLKKGLAQAETNPQQAQATLKEVASKFPGTVEAQNAAAKLKELGSAPRGRTPAR
jgi:tol-pal system protein YbgF